MRHMRHVRNAIRYRDRLYWAGLAEDLVVLAAWMIPRQVAYWVIIRMAAPFGCAPDAITVLDVLRRHDEATGRG